MEFPECHLWLKLTWDSKDLKFAVIDDRGFVVVLSELLPKKGDGLHSPVKMSLKGSMVAVVCHAVHQKVDDRIRLSSCPREAKRLHSPVKLAPKGSMVTFTRYDVLRKAYGCSPLSNCPSEGRWSHSPVKLSFKKADGSLTSLPVDHYFLRLLSQGGWWCDALEPCGLKLLNTCNTGRRIFSQ